MIYFNKPRRQKKMKPFYTWVALLEDNNVIHQYEKDKETMFSEIEKNKNKLESFKIVGDDESFCEVFLKGKKKGTINLNDDGVKEIKNKKLDLELIYSRRGQVRVQVGSGEILNSRVTHRIGLKNVEQEVVCEIFPGVEMAEKKARFKDVNRKSKEGTIQDITKNFKLKKK
jgi:hypothetical protein